MFLLIYIYLLIIAGMGGYAILENVTWIDFFNSSRHVYSPLC